MSLLKVNNIESLEGATGPLNLVGNITFNGSVVVGVTGPTGPQGAIGATGTQGSTGPQGEIGPTGPQGEIGPTGTQGATGPQGEIGPTGPQGEIGPTGPQGENGATGPQGEIGPTGPAGEAGTGSNIFYGDQSIQGPTGTLILLGYSTLGFTGDAPAALGGVPLGGIYHDNGSLRIRLT